MPLVLIEDVGFASVLGGLNAEANGWMCYDVDGWKIFISIHGLISREGDLDCFRACRFCRSNPQCLLISFTHVFSGFALRIGDRHLISTNHQSSHAPKQNFLQYTSVRAGKSVETERHTSIPPSP